ncbi:MAG: desulfoferrodoxin [Candidatus Magasanikbacteria bacterium]|nr:desulfoferrodoxin [Candidatus Magasanikbacteria bacterium]
MTELKQVYKCSVCGNIVEVLHTGVGELVCCGKPMELQAEKMQDEGAEKHVPVVEKTETGLKIKIGSVSHPMAEEHYIEWIEVITGSGVFRETLKPGDAPEVEFAVKEEIIEVRAHCNIHGLWKK